MVKFHTLFHPKLGITVDAVTMIGNTCNRAEEVDGEHLGGDAPGARVSPDGQTTETWPPSMNIITCGAVDPNAATSNRWTTPTIDAVTTTENASTRHAIARKKMGQNSTSRLIAELQSSQYCNIKVVPQCCEIILGERMAVFGDQVGKPSPGPSDDLTRESGYTK